MNNRQDLRKRTKDYALRVINLYAALPDRAVAQVVGKQFCAREPRLARNIVKLAVRNQMLTS